MVAGWLALVLLLSALLFAVARLLERLGRVVVPARGIWAGAMAAMLLLAFTAPLRTTPAETGPTMGAAGAAGVAVVAPIDAPTTTAGTPGWRVLGDAVARMGAPITRAADAVARLATPYAGVHAGRWFVAAWGAMSLVVLGGLVAGYRRLMRRIAGGTSHSVAGVPVVITDDVGPLVAGVRAPRIVLPRWLLDRPADEQALVVAHEQSHVAARDPRLLLCGALGLVLLPWNPFSWWFLARLRLAIEVDCDRRLLRRGASPAHYGRLLIDLSASAPRLPLAAPAFSHRTTHLERRIRAMTTRVPRHRRAVGLVLAAAAAVVLVTACEAKLPTAFRVESMDVAELERRAAPGLTLAPAGTRYVLDGRPATEAEVRALPSERIAALEIHRGTSPSAPGNTLFVTTRPPGDTTAATVVASRPDGSVVIGTIASRDSEWNAADGDFELRDARVLPRREDATAANRGDESVMLPWRPRVVDDSGHAVMGAIIRVAPRVPLVAAPFTATPSPGAPLVYIDGVRRDEPTLTRLSPDRIASIEVIKGAAATRVYGPDAIAGVIAVTTKQP
jgi:hypothetical protein